MEKVIFCLYSHAIVDILPRPLNSFALLMQKLGAVLQELNPKDRIFSRLMHHVLNIYPCISRLTGHRMKSGQRGFVELNEG